MEPGERERRQEAALRWVNEHWRAVDKRCPICTDSNWTIGPVFEMREFESGNLILGGNSNIYPAFPLSCTTCGYTHWFNAMQAGIIAPPAASSGGMPQESPNDDEDAT